MTNIFFFCRCTRFLVFSSCRRPLLVEFLTCHRHDVGEGEQWGWGRAPPFLQLRHRNIQDWQVSRNSIDPSSSHHISPTHCEMMDGRPSTIGTPAGGFHPRTTLGNYYSIAHLRVARVGPELSHPPLILVGFVPSLGTCQAPRTLKSPHAVSPQPQTQGSTAPKHPRQRVHLLDPYITARPQ